MGANCFVAARDNLLHYKTGNEVSTYRNIGRFTCWSSQRVMRGHTGDNREIPLQLSYRNSRNATTEVKSEVDVVGDGFSDEDPSMTSRSSKQIKFIRNKDWGKVKSISSDQPAGNESSPEGKVSPKLSVLPSISEKKAFITLPSLSPAYKMTDPSSSRSGIIPSSEATSSRKSLNKISSLDRRNSILLGHDYESFDNENPVSFNCKILESKRNLIDSSFLDLQSCSTCTKLLKEKPPQSSLTIVPNELSVIAVLVCGHVYHAECLERSTPETEKYDPPCPVCTNKPKSSVKSELKCRNKVSRIAVADIDADGDSSSSNHKKRTGKDPIIRASSRWKSSRGPFLRRHFSMGSQQARLIKENEKRSKAFWAKIL